MQVCIVSTQDEADARFQIQGPAEIHHPSEMKPGIEKSRIPGIDVEIASQRRD
jgi:hypothetical protein